MGGAVARDAQASPLWSDLAGLPPIRIDVGSDEVLLDDARRFHAAARASGTSCGLHVWQNMVHVFPSNTAMLKAASEALDGVGGFLRAAFAPAGASR